MEGLVLLVNGAEEARAAVRKLVKDGVEWVKTYPTGDAAAPDTNDHHTLCMTFEEMHAVERRTEYRLIELHLDLRVEGNAGRAIIRCGTGHDWRRRFRERHPEAVARGRRSI